LIGFVSNGWKFGGGEGRNRSTDIDKMGFNAV